MTEVSHRYAGFWIRALASLIDDFIVLTVSVVFGMVGLYLIFLVTHPAPTFGEAFTGGFIQTIVSAAMTFVSIPYYIVFHWQYGWTPGKRIFRIRVVRERDDGKLTLGRSTGRYFAQILSALPFGAGFLMAGLNSHHRALHDVIAGTVSIFDPEPVEEV
jgi:uncharacterized RDD family membrane protein YckC